MIGKTAKAISKIAAAAFLALGAPVFLVIATLAPLPYFSRVRSRTSIVYLFSCFVIVTVPFAYVITNFSHILDQTPDQTLAQPSNQAKIFVNLGWKNMMSNPPDYALSMRNNRSGYELHHPEGAANIGLLYENGWGVAKDAAEAATWYKEAIEIGMFRSAQADYQLAGLYENGVGVKKDMAQAIGHYSAALRISTGAGHSHYIDKKSAQLATNALDRLNGKQ